MGGCVKVTDGEMHSRRKMQTKDGRKEFEKLKDIEDKCPCFDKWLHSLP